MLGRCFEACSQGNESVAHWDTIVSEHGPAMFRAAFRILANAADAEDVVQDAFVEALGLWRRGEVTAWTGLLRHLAMCRAIDRLRLRKPTVSGDTLLSVPSSEDPVADLVGRELADQ